MVPEAEMHMLRWICSNKRRIELKMSNKRVAQRKTKNQGISFEMVWSLDMFAEVESSPNKWLKVQATRRIGFLE